MKTKCIGLLAFLLLSIGNAQPKQQLIDITVVPVETDWIYALGDRADFEISVRKNGRLLSGATVDYEIGLEGVEPRVKKSLTLNGKPLVVKGIELKDPGFVRCNVSFSYEGKTYKGLGAAGFAPEKIAPTVKDPPDFDVFWEQAKIDLSKIPMNAKMSLVAEESTGSYNVYHVELDNLGTPGQQGKSKFYGMLSIPKKPGTYPAVLGVPGAGVRPYFGDERAAEGVIVFKVGIHGIPVNLETQVYSALGQGALSGYATLNMHNKDRYYYKRVYMGCIRAVDFIHSLPQFDGQNLVVSGGSQGGALSIVTAALDQRIKGLVAFYPAMSDMTGYLYGRVGGWPHQFEGIDTEIRKAWEDTAGYYDVVNFAKRLKVPGWYSWGYNDYVCPPTTTFSVYNSITAPKQLHVVEETGHWTYPEQWNLANTWTMQRLTGQ